MTPALLRTLEFDRIIAALASFALTPVGKVRMFAEQPQTDRAVVALADGRLVGLDISAV